MGFENKRFGRGFTLVELVLVMVIIVLVAAIVYPAFGNVFKGVSARSKRYSLLASLRQARWKALADGSDYRASLTRENETWKIQFEKFDSFAGKYVLLNDSWSQFTTEEVPQINSITQNPVTTQNPASGEKYVIEFKPAGVEVDSLIELGTEGDKWLITISRFEGIVSLVKYDQTKQTANEKTYLKEYFAKNYGSNF